MGTVRILDGKMPDITRDEVRRICGLDEAGHRRKLPSVGSSVTPEEALDALFDDLEAYRILTDRINAPDCA
jgi:hypothetical protein